MDEAGATATSTLARARSGLVLILLVVTPLFWGANRPLPLLGAELTALALLVLCLADPARLRASSVSMRWALGLLLLVPLIYLIPLPPGWFAAMPGRALYGEVLTQIGSADWRPLAVYPLAGEYSWLALLPPVAVCLALTMASRREALAAAIAIVAVAVAEAVLGLIQYGDGPESVFRLGNPFYLDSAVGTFANRNHLAGLLEMAAMLSLGVLAALLTTRRRRHGGEPGGSAAAVMVCGFAFLVLLVGLLYTRSRTGVALGVLGTALAFWLFARRAGSGVFAGVMGGALAAGLAAAGAIGLLPVLERFTAQDPLGDVRWTVFGATLQAAGEFFPLGSGPGTFPYVFPRFQPATLDYFVNHAHNDYLEWLVEAGLLAIVAVGAFLFLYARRWIMLLRHAEPDALTLVQMGAGLGIALLLLHGLVDFNLRIPSNAIAFAALMGLFFHPALVAELSKSAAKPRPPPVTTAQENLHPLQKPPTEVPNPFAE